MSWWYDADKEDSKQLAAIGWGWIAIGGLVYIMQAVIGRTVPLEVWFWGGSELVMVGGRVATYEQQYPVGAMVTAVFGIAVWELASRYYHNVIDEEYGSLRAWGAGVRDRVSEVGESS
jgi:hypothetical protein